MSLPTIVTREQWLQERKALLAEEKAMTHARDALSTKRRELPMVEITKDYRFVGAEGDVSLLDLFDGQPQLMVVHFMFDPSWDDGCPSCTAGADENSPGMREHMLVRNTRQVYVSRAPIEKLEDYKRRRGWTFDWYSSGDGDFNYDFHVTLDPSRAPMEHNYRPLEGDGAIGEYPGMSFFLRDGDRVFHTYSLYARGTEWLGGSYAALDLTALGRQEDWEEPKGRSDNVRTNMPDFAS